MKHRRLLMMSFPFVQTATEGVESLQMIQTMEVVATPLAVLAEKSLQVTVEGETLLHVKVIVRRMVIP